MIYKTTRYKYTYARKTRDRYQIFARPKNSRKDWELILDTLDFQTFEDYRDTIEYPLTPKTQTKYNTKTHDFKYIRHRENVNEITTLSNQ